jgi:hypothetical protein
MIDRVREVAPPPLNARDKEMVRVAQRCIMASLDHSRAAAITLTTDTGEHPTVEVPPAVSKPVRWIGWQTMPESWDWITGECTRSDDQSLRCVIAILVFIPNS